MAEGVLHLCGMWLSLCAFGLAQGMRHALEPDHLAAVLTLQDSLEEHDTEATTRAWRSVRYATMWGFGHASMLLLVGGALYVARGAMPEGVTLALECGVAVMLIALGLRGIVRALRFDADAHARDHARGGHTHVHVGDRTIGVLPFAVGLVHGLAGSGALATLVMASQPELGMGVSMLVVYALGTVLGMTLLAGALGKPLQALAQRRRARRALLGITGLLSLLIGVWWGMSTLQNQPASEALSHLLP